MSVGEWFELIKPYWLYIVAGLVLLVVAVTAIVITKRRKRKTMVIKKQVSALVFQNGLRVKKTVEEAVILGCAKAVSREYEKGKVILLEPIPPATTIEKPSGNGEHEKETAKA